MIKWTFGLTKSLLKLFIALKDRYWSLFKNRYIRIDSYDKTYNKNWCNFKQWNNQIANPWLKTPNKQIFWQPRSTIMWTGANFHTEFLTAKRLFSFRIRSCGPQIFFSAYSCLDARRFIKEYWRIFVLYIKRYLTKFYILRVSWMILRGTVESAFQHS